MLVVHWAKHNLTGRILRNGIRPSSRRINPRGVYVYPYSRFSTLSGTWRRNLKVWDRQLGNYNGFVFRLAAEDFPVIAGDWYDNRVDPEKSAVATLDELAKRCGAYFSGQIINELSEGNDPYDWEDFEIIIPRGIRPSRFIKVLKDRSPRRQRDNVA